MTALRRRLGGAARPRWLVGWCAGGLGGRRSVRTAGAVAALAALMLSCGARPGPGPKGPRWARSLPADLPVSGELTVRPEAHDEPALELRFPWSNPRTALGWGAVHLWSRPAVDHVSVTAIVDAPSRRARWEGCRDVTLDIDGRPTVIEARYIGRPLSDGGLVYEAVQLDLNIHQLRSLARAQRVRGSICGDPLRVGSELRPHLQHFVEWFDHIAEPRRLDRRPYFRDVGPRPSLPLEDMLDPELLDG